MGGGAACSQLTASKESLFLHPFGEHFAANETAFVSFVYRPALPLY